MTRALTGRGVRDWVKKHFERLVMTYVIEKITVVIFIYVFSDAGRKDETTPRLCIDNTIHF